MLNNYFTIKETAQYLNHKLSGLVIEDCYTQEKNKLLFEISNPADRSSFILEFSIEKDYNYLIIKNNYSKAKKNFASLFEEIYSSKISCVNLFNEDRIISIELEAGRQLIFTMYSAKANCYLLTDGIVTDAFKDKPAYSGKSISEILPAKIPGNTSENKTVSDILKKHYRKYGRLYIAEVLQNLDLKRHQPIDEIIEAKLKEEFDKAGEKLSSPQYLLFSNSEDTQLSLIEPEHLQEYEKQAFENINDLITNYLRSKFKTEKTGILKDKNVSILEKKVADIEKKIRGIELQLMHCEDSESLKKTGDIILQYIYLIKKGDTELKYTDESSAEQKIKLKKDLTPSENAGYYFDKYKKQKNSIDTLKAKLKSMLSDKAATESELQKVKNMTEYKSLIKEEKKTEQAKNDETSRFRKFVLNEKFEVWVGKDSASNDKLTTKYAAQNDLWFHVRGASGSHTVLKASNKKDEIGKEFILKAAAIAAYYSKARNASNVPVAYCEKKYVKKKKGFKQGSVVMEREKVVFVKPALP